MGVMSAFNRLLKAAGIEKRAGEISQDQILPASDTSAMADRKARMRNSGRYPNAKILLAPKVGEIDNKAYAQSPYANPLNFDKINQTLNLPIYDEEKNIIKNKFAPNLSATFLNTYPIYDNLLINSYLENEDIIK